MVDVERVFKNTVKKGTVHFGVKQTTAAVQQKKAKLVVLSTNCPENTTIRELTKKHSIPLYEYNNSSVQLGNACGKQYPVSVFSVIDEGDTTILHLVKEKK